MEVEVEEELKYPVEVLAMEEIVILFPEVPSQVKMAVVVMMMEPSQVEEVPVEHLGVPCHTVLREEMEQVPRLVLVMVEH